MLNEYGAKYALNQESEKFFDDLDEALNALKPTIMFECLGGALPGKIFEKMGDYS